MVIQERAQGRVREDMKVPESRALLCPRSHQAARIHHVDQEVPPSPRRLSLHALPVNQNRSRQCQTQNRDCVLLLQDNHQQQDCSNEVMKFPP